ncbi:MAG: hypothetical protein H7A43_02730 [Verrucomicrobia bacterium]|nr:hypothetical protein [Verrucomicrobiota bacterium]
MKRIREKAITGAAVLGLVLIVLARFRLGIVPLFLGQTAGISISALFTQRLIHAQQQFGVSLILSGLLLWLLPGHNLSVAGIRSGEQLLSVIRKGSPIVAGLLCLAVQSVVFQNQPHITDATSHVFQAKLFALGHLTARVPDCFPAFFQHNVVMNINGGWHTKYFPGQAAWLAPGFALGAPWLMMPLGWAITTWAFSKLIENHYTVREQFFALALFTLSPLGLLVSASYMSHTTFLMWMLLTFVGWRKGLESQRRSQRWFMVAGLCAGFAAITRPQDMIPAMAGAITAFLFLPMAQKAKTIRFMIPGILGGMTSLALLLFWNAQVYGAWFSSGYNFGSSYSLTPIIQDSLGFTNSHTPAKAWQYLLRAMLRFDTALLGWPTCLPLLLIPFVRWPRETKHWVCGSVLITTVGLYALFPYDGFELEARYYTPMIPAAILLIASSLAGWTQSTRPEWRRIGQIFILSGILYSGLHVWPHSIWPKYAHAYEQVDMRVYQLAQEVIPPHQKALILMKEDLHNDFFFSSGFIHNDPELTHRLLFARYLPDQISCLAQAFPDRSMFVIDAMTRTIRPLDTTNR